MIHPAQMGLCKPAVGAYPRCGLKPFDLWRNTGNQKKHESHLQHGKIDPHPPSPSASGGLPCPVHRGGIFDRGAKGGVEKQIGIV